MVYAGIKYLIRQQMTEQDAFCPDMKKKSIRRPTVIWVFFCFQGISALLIDKTTEVIAFNLQ